MNLPSYMSALMIQAAILLLEVKYCSFSFKFFVNQVVVVAYLIVMLID